MATPKIGAGLTRAQLVKASQMRSQGKTWNQIRAYVGKYVASGTFQTLWAREGIDHLPSRHPEAQVRRIATREANRQAKAKAEAKAERAARKAAKAAASAE